MQNQLQQITADMQLEEHYETLEKALLDLQVRHFYFIDFLLHICFQFLS